MGRDLGTTILVENTPLSFCFQPSNAILVPTWTTDDADTELLGLMALLDEVAYESDVRPILAKRCQMDELIQKWQVCALSVEQQEPELGPAEPPSSANEVVDLDIIPSGGGEDDDDDGVADEVTTVVYATPSRESNSSTSNGQPLNSPRTSGSSGSSTPRPDTSSFQTSAAATADLMKKSPSLRSVA